MALPNNADKTDVIDPVKANIEAIASLHAHVETRLERHQRNVETVTAELGRPRFLFGIVSVVGIWILGNTLAPNFGLRRIDPPPFYWLQGVVGLSGLLMTIVVLITQNRLGKIADQREQLDLQMSLMAEQRTAKIIQLLEELRRDLPTVQDRIDPEAEKLQEAVDPEAVLTALEFKLKEVLEEPASEAPAGVATAPLPNS
jgi:uncharacterized membrane protein